VRCLRPRRRGGRRGSTRPVFLCRPRRPGPRSVGPGPASRLLPQLTHVRSRVGLVASRYRACCPLVVPFRDDQRRLELSSSSVLELEIPCSSSVLELAPCN
jgi:hypothetical protein